MGFIRLRRWFIVPVLVLALVAGRTVPANAFLSALDPAGWAVVAQMAAVLSQAIAIKRQVENVRNQARADYFGKLAPLTGKLTKVRGYIQQARQHASVSVYIPNAAVRLFEPGDPASELPPFNDEAPPCVTDPNRPGVVPDPTHPGCQMIETVIPATAITLTTDAVANSYATPIFPGATPPAAESVRQYREGMDATREELQALMARAEASVDLAEQRRLARRVSVEAAMGIAEDWRGCQPAPETGAVIDPANDTRLPCVTNDGRGRQELIGGVESGTTGLQEQLATNLEALEAFQDGDVSKTQVDTLQTQLLLTLGRIESARADLEARRMEEEDQDAQIAEAQRRRRIAFMSEQLDCVYNQAPVAVHTMARFIPADPNNPTAGGTCVFPMDRSGQADWVASLADLSLD